jgi:ABC-type transport system substrate-binding protein
MMVRSLANMTVTFFLHMDPGMTQTPSLWRPVEEMDPVYTQARSTPEVEDELIQELHKMMLDNMVVVPVYDTYDTFIVRKNVHDAGFSEWSAATVWMPADAWKSQ